MENKSLLLNLVQCDSEKDVIKILKNVGYWNDVNAWQYYGDYENNFSTIGNQQRKPEAAIVEKIINSVDAVLMCECLSEGINPESEFAPQTINNALNKYFGIYNGKLSSINPAERTNLADKIQFVATGSKTNPSYIIADRGEGQTPNSFSATLLSLRKSNKLRIPFVQGKFNMGGTGVLRFCGNNNIQLILSKRHPKLAKNVIDESKNNWGFTIIRRFNPTEKIRSSCYKYLAPNNKILQFNSDYLNILPGEYPDAYKGNLQYGTFIKLYDYQMTGLKTNIIFDLYNRLSLLLPNIALPVRLYERRKGYKGHSLQSTMSGLSVRLDEDKNENLESDFNPPPSSKFSVSGQNMSFQIIVFKRGKEENYKRKEGIIFTVNGQTHASIEKSFFTRKSVGMSYLKDSILIIVDCSEIDGRSREDLFMNSRDRLSSGELRTKIEDVLTDELKNHQGLKELRERRRREDIENKLEDSKPLVEVVQNILKKSPTLAKLFIKGVRITNPFKLQKAKKKENFVGKRFPTYFKLNKDFTKDQPKHCPLNVRCRIQFETDVNNNYFDRDLDPGSFKLTCNDDEVDSSINLWNGHATLNIDLPNKIEVGDYLHFKSIIEDVKHLVDPFISDFCVLVTEKVNNSEHNNGKRKPPASEKNGDDTKKTDLLSLPNIRLIYQQDWEKLKFIRTSALKVVDSGDNGYDFYINMDNVYLLSEKKSSSVNSKLLDARYQYGLVLIGLALLKEYESNENEDLNENGHDIFEEIKKFSSTISPILLPMISGLGDLDID